MTRITPRTCLWPLTGSLILTFALSIGLTFVSDHHCYAGTCGETLFPLQARLHVIIWYSWISISVAILGIRAFSPTLRSILRRQLIHGKIPHLGKHFSLSGALLILWITLLYGIIVGVWWLRLHDYFQDRGRHGGVERGNNRLAAIALTGHVCDVTMGMVLLPISRHSALASFFKLSVSTTLAFHMIMAYFLFILVLLHGFLYASWVPVYHRLSAQLRQVFPVLNPTYVYSETWPGDRSALGVWKASLLFTGLFTATIMCLVFFTSFPSVRAKHFNVFYFSHLTVILGIIVICLHASTMWYCTSPGLIMWLLDWAMRLYELRKSLDGQITTFGNGWYCLRIALPRHRLQGCACTSPLAHFYIHHANSSIRELHPFTTITHLASANRITPPEEDDLQIQFLFRRRGQTDSPSEKPLGRDDFATTVLRLFSHNKRRKSQWTDQLAELVHSGANMPADLLSPVAGINISTDLLSPTSSQAKPSSLPYLSSPTANSSRHGSVAATGNNSRHDSIMGFTPDHPHPISDVQLRLEGPYFTPADPHRYHTVICLVAGTGISGALAIAAAFAESQRAASEYICDECRDCDACALPKPGTALELKTKRIWTRCVVIWTVREETYAELPFLQEWRAKGVDVILQLTGKGRPRLVMDAVLRTTIGTEGESPTGRTWVYLSGPTAFVTAGEEACKQLAAAGMGVEYYGARW